MARQAATTVENSFVNGLITEASGMNFPQHAVTETYDCIFNWDGSVERRAGFDFETSYATKTIDRTGSVVNTYLWRNVSGDGTVSLFVAQVGGTIYFYQTQLGALSIGAVTSNIALSTFAIGGSPPIASAECQFAAGNGFLFVTHPYCDPFYVSYNTATNIASGTVITLQIRDFLGLDSGFAVDNRPTATLAGLGINHKYNLYNQGWNTANLTTWDTARTDLPSNCDIMWQLKNSSDAFDLTAITNTISGNSPATRGHFILSLCNQDRATVSGVGGIAAVTTGFQRPQTCAFHAGRVFYAGINSNTFNYNIYFSQIVQSALQYGQCYMQSDPTSEDNFTLLPSDGGSIQILDAGTIYKLISVIGALIVFASNGVWTITGSTGLGFTATDYVVSKISAVPTISASSFVDVNGVPMWWNYDGIYTIAQQQQGGFAVQNVTLTKIKTFFDAIAPISKLNAKGFYHKITGIVQWVYNTDTSTSLDRLYQYDRILNYSTRTGGFYPWTIDKTNVSVNGICVVDDLPVSQVQVADVNDAAAETVIDAAGDVVTSYTIANTTNLPEFVYLCSYPNAGSYKFTIAVTTSVTYTDWFKYNSIGVNYLSYLISGYKLDGNAIKKFQSNYIRIYSDNVSDTAFYFKGRWDYATNKNSGRWTNRQYVLNSDGKYGVLSKRLKVRGNGLALQFHIESIDGQPFNILGWATQETSNMLP